MKWDWEKLPALLSTQSVCSVITACRRRAPAHLENEINSFRLSGDHRCQPSQCSAAAGACGSGATGDGAYGAGIGRDLLWEVLEPMGNSSLGTRTVPEMQFDSDMALWAWTLETSWIVCSLLGVLGMKHNGSIHPRQVFPLGGTSLGLLQFYFETLFHLVAQASLILLRY